MTSCSFLSLALRHQSKHCNTKDTTSGMLLWTLVHHQLLLLYAAINTLLSTLDKVIAQAEGTASLLPIWLQHTLCWTRSPGYNTISSSTVVCILYCTGRFLDAAALGATQTDPNVISKHQCKYLYNKQEHFKLTGSCFDIKRARQFDEQTQYRDRLSLKPWWSIGMSRYKKKVASYIENMIRINALTI